MLQGRNECFTVIVIPFIKFVAIGNYIMKPYLFYILSLGVQLAMDTAKEILTDMQFFCNMSVNAHGTQCFIFCA